MSEQLSSGGCSFLHGKGQWVQKVQKVQKVPWGIVAASTLFICFLPLEGGDAKRRKLTEISVISILGKR